MMYEWPTGTKEGLDVMIDLWLRLNEWNKLVGGGMKDWWNGWNWGIEG